MGCVAKSFLRQSLFRPAGCRSRAPCGAQVTVEEYLKAMDMYPSTEFTERPKLMDPIEADHYHAFVIANTRERTRQADAFNAIRELKVAAYMRANKVTT